MKWLDWIHLRLVFCFAELSQQVEIFDAIKVWKQQDLQFLLHVESSRRWRGMGKNFPPKPPAHAPVSDV